MGGKMTFDERLNTLIMSEKNGGAGMALQEVLDYFADMDLTEDQIEKVYLALEKSHEDFLEDDVQENFSENDGDMDLSAPEGFYRRRKNLNWQNALNREMRRQETVCQRRICVL